VHSQGEQRKCLRGSETKNVLTNYTMMKFCMGVEGKIPHELEGRRMRGCRVPRGAHDSPLPMA